MKKLSDFKDEQAFGVVADILPEIMKIVSNPENKKASGGSAFGMFSAFFKNSSKNMMNIFAALSETPAEDYHCDAIDVTQNILTLVSDERLMDLFISQSQTGDATSSGSASENTEDQ